MSADGDTRSQDDFEQTRARLQQRLAHAAVALREFMNCSACAVSVSDTVSVYVGPRDVVDALMGKKRAR